MERRYTIVCDGRTASTVEALAREYSLTEQEVLRQLIDIGIEELGAERPRA